MNGINLKEEIDFILGLVKKKVESGNIKQYQINILEGKITKNVLDEVNKYFEI